MKTKLRAGWLWPACAFTMMGIAHAQTVTEHVVHAFANWPYGAHPPGTLAADGSGNLYGTAVGGLGNLGVVFKLGKSGIHVLYAFRGGTDGSDPWAGVTLDSAGNLYGTTNSGGSANAGVVYKVSAAGQETVLYSFMDGADGGHPYAGVILDSEGNLYGTTYDGGTGNAGVVYKVSPSGQETVLHSFTGSPSDGASPYAGVIADAAGNLYGTTQFGGHYGFGVVYKLDPSGQETVLYQFGANGTPAGSPKAGVIRDPAGNLYGIGGSAIYELTASGAYKTLQILPRKSGGGTVAGLTRDAAGNLYGTTVQSNNSDPSNGTVFRLDTAGQLTLLHTFTGGADGANPYGGLILDATGNLYGTALGGGKVDGGVVYKVSPAGQETVLYSFAPAAGGTTLRGGVILDAAGNLYGTTFWGGAVNQGVLFKLDPSGHETLLHTFTGGADGGGPSGDLALDSAGNLYGSAGGGTAGVVYKVSPSGQETVLYSFTGGADGEGPNGVMRDSAGNLYGTTYLGGTANTGVVFKVDPSGQETVLYSFTGGADGANPTSGVILDPAGNLYGTTDYGGVGAGVVYKLDTAGHETVLYSFRNGADGANPFAGVIRDSSGNLYGTTQNGVPNGGRLYELSASGDYTVLYSFTGVADGATPVAGVVRDSAGNLYGTTQAGGESGCGYYTCGVVYKLDTSGQLTVLHSFTGPDGGQPLAGVTPGPAGSLFGTASAGGIAGGGVVYELTSH